MEGKENFLFQQIFGKLSDPRRTGRGNFRHSLHDIVLLVVAGVLCGLDDWEQIADFGRIQQRWLRKYGSFRNGIPSHDTLNRVFSALDPSAFGACFVQWANAVRGHSSGEVVAIDGKCIRGSGHDGNPATHMVSAYAAENRLCLGHVATSAKSNEITAIPQLLDLLDIQGCTVTIDAMGCQKDIAKKIRDNGAEYILAVKGNQQTLEEGIADTVRFYEPSDEHEDLDCGHGRVETRRCQVYDKLDMIEGIEKWEGIKTVVKIESTRYEKTSGKCSQESRYYISSQRSTAVMFNKWVRSHWAIENNLHWCLDVVYGEDQSRKRKENAAHNFNTVCKTVMSMIEKDKTWKASTKRKRSKALQNKKYREWLLKF